MTNFNGSDESTLITDIRDLPLGVRQLVHTAQGCGWHGFDYVPEVKRLRVWPGVSGSEPHITKRVIVERQEGGSFMFSFPAYGGLEEAEQEFSAKTTQVALEFALANVLAFVSSPVEGVFGSTEVEW